MNNEITTKCCVCGNSINAGRCPPICDEPNCKFEYNLEVEFHRWAKEREKK
jgi:hypothetical protein